MLKGYLLLDCDRTYANIDRKINGKDHKKGQNLQQYMSDSPWDSSAVFKQAQEDIKSRPFLGGGTLNFDETGDECSGPKKAGAARQHIGRSGKVDMGQVVVLGSFYRDGYWLLTDADLFLPKQWFEAPLKKEWKRLHIPSDRTFKSKVEILENHQATRHPQFDYSWSLFDGCIEAVYLPGHALGQIGIRFNFRDHALFLVADASWFTSAIDDQTYPNRLVSMILPDWKAFKNTLANLHEFKRLNPDVMLIPTHCSERQVPNNLN